MAVILRLADDVALFRIDGSTPPMGVFDQGVPEIISRSEPRLLDAFFLFAIGIIEIAPVGAMLLNFFVIVAVFERLIDRCLFHL